MKRIPWIVSVSLTVTMALLCSVPYAQVSPARRPPAIFEHIRASLPPESPILRHSHAYQPVLVRWQIVRALQPGSRVLFNLLEDVNLIGRVDRIEQRASSRFSCFGRLEDSEGSSFILVVEEDALAMSLLAPELGTTFELRCVRDDLYVVVVASERLSCGTCECMPRPNLEPTPEDASWLEHYSRRAPKETDTDLSLLSCVQPQAVLDTAVYYTEQARQAVGGVNQMNARIQLYVDQSNEAYRNSRIDLRMRLVRRLEVTYPGEGNGNYLDQINQLTTPNDGVIDQVHPDRSNYRADQVVLLVANSNVCGVAWCGNGNDPQWAFSVVNVNSLCPALVFAHEVGHNQGCGHARGDGGGGYDGGCGFRSYGWGWRFTGNDGVLYRTVMAYHPGTWIPHFSNPEVLYRGAPTGVPIGQPDEAHNAQVINETRRSRETFRLLDIWVQFGYSGMERGTFNEPFNTVAEGVNEITTFIDTSLVPFPTLYIKAGSSSERVRITKRLRMEACGGTVRIGRL